MDLITFTAGAVLMLAGLVVGFVLGRKTTKTVVIDSGTGKVTTYNQDEKYVEEPAENEELSAFKKKQIEEKRKKQFREIREGVDDAE